MLSAGNTATSGTIEHEGVRYDSNSLSSDDMKSVLGIEEPAEPSDPETPPDPADPPVEPADPADAAPVEAKPKTDAPPKAKKNPQERFDKLTFEREEARREAARERQQREEAERRFDAFQRQVREQFESLKSKEQPQSKAQPSADGEPTLEQFADQADPYAAWMRAMARHDARQEFKAQQDAQRQAYEQSQQQRQQQEREHHERQRLTTWTQRMETAFAKDPALRQTIEDMPVLPRPMMDVIIESDIPDRILGHLLAHPEDQARISALHPLHQFRELSRIEYQLEQAASALTGSAAPKAKTTAHPPVSPVSGSHAAPSASGEPGPDASYEEHRAYWNQVEAAQRKARR